MSKEDFTKFEWIIIIAWSIFIMSLIYFLFQNSVEPKDRNFNETFQHIHEQLKPKQR